eukprot:2156142-Rhodomonas_salina.2
MAFTADVGSEVEKGQGCVCTVRCVPTPVRIRRYGAEVYDYGGGTNRAYGATAQDYGYFMFGGSTVICVWQVPASPLLRTARRYAKSGTDVGQCRSQEGKIKFDEDLIKKSQVPSPT